MFHYHVPKILLRFLSYQIVTQTHAGLIITQIKLRKEPLTSIRIVPSNTHHQKDSKQRNPKRRLKETNLTNTINEVAKEKPRRANEKLLPFRSMSERNPKQGPRLILVFHLQQSSTSQNKESPNSNPKKQKPNPTLTRWYYFFNWKKKKRV